MLNYKEIKYHHDNTVENCLGVIRGFSETLSPGFAKLFQTALSDWDGRGCGKPGTDAAVIATGIAHFHAAYAELSDPCEPIYTAITTLDHKLLKHQVNEHAMKGANLSTRTGLCPICGQPVSTVLSQARCYYCDSRLSWK